MTDIPTPNEVFGHRDRDVDPGRGSTHPEDDVRDDPDTEGARDVLGDGGDLDRDQQDGEDPDADPEMLNPRDDPDHDGQHSDPDADPGMLNPRDETT